jgi:hypothetical protein
MHTHMILTRIYTHIFLFHKVASRNDIVNMALQEGQIIICGECDAPMGDGVIQSGGTIRFVCTENLGHILFVRQNN